MLRFYPQVDPLVFGLRVAMLFQPGAYLIMGYGGQTQKAAHALRRGELLSQAGLPPQGSRGSGNGAAMRSAILGPLLYRKTRLEAVQATQAMAAATHASQAAYDSSVSVMLAARYAYRTAHEAFDAARCVEYVCSSEGMTEQFKGHIRELLQLRLASLDDARKRVVAIAEGEYKEASWGGSISSGARQTALWSLLCFLKHPDSFTECVAHAIAVGGDVDTTAAIAGGVVGARVGRVGIPQAWCESVHDRKVPEAYAHYHVPAGGGGIMQRAWAHDELCGLMVRAFELMD